MISKYILFSGNDALRHRPKIRGWALDIDETITKTRERFTVALLEAINPENLQLEEYTAQYPDPYNPPQYHNTPETHTLLRELFSNNEWQKTLDPMDNAKKVLSRIGHIIGVYISARPQKVASGTIAWLRKHRMPIAPVILRPNTIPDIYATQWKSSLIKKLDLDGIIDDHRGLPHALAKRNFRGTHILLNTVPLTENFPRVRQVNSWREVHDSLYPYISRYRKK